MLHNRINEEFLLDVRGVDNTVNIMDSWMQAAKVQKKNRLRSRLAMDAILLHLCEHYKEKQNVTLKSGRRFGRNYFSVEYEGEPYNPMETEEQSGDGWTYRLLSNVGLNPIWRYKYGVNELTLKLPANEIKSEIWLLAAFGAAILLGIIGPAIPEAVKAGIIEYVFNTVTRIFTNLMGTFAGILVFLSVISGICGVGNISDFSKYGKYLVIRHILFCYTAAGACLLIMFSLFSFSWGTPSGGNQFSAVLDLIISIIPSDPVTPFAKGNMLQIVFMAVLIGVIIMALSRESKIVRDFCFQANTIAMRLIEISCRLLSIYILCSLTKLFWDNGMGLFVTAWKPLAICIVGSFALMFIKIFVAARKCGVPAGLLFKKVTPALIIGLTTASSTAAIGTVMEINSKKLGIPEELNKFAIPVQNILCCDTTSMGFTAIIFYLAEYHNTPVDAGWFLIAWIVIPLVTFAIPPVSGGSLVVLSVLLSLFGIPAGALAIAGTLAIICDFFITGTRIVISEMELVMEAKHWENLDEEKLKMESVVGKNTNT